MTFQDEGDLLTSATHVGRLAVPAGVVGLYVTRHPDGRTHFHAEPPGDEVILWCDAGGTHRQRRGGRLLSEFLKLANASLVGVETFARHYGPLRIGGARLQNPGLLLPEEALGRLWPRGDKDSWRKIHKEDVRVWRDWSAKLGAALRIADQIRRGKTGAPSDWLVVGTPVPAHSYPVNPTFAQSLPPDKQHLLPPPIDSNATWNPESTMVAKNLLAKRVNGWLEEAGVRPWLNWAAKDRRPAVVIGAGDFSEGGHLLGALVWDFAIRLGRADRTAVCSYCGTHYSPGRMPAPNDCNYCPECHGNGIPDRERKRRQRNREVKG